MFRGVAAVHVECEQTADSPKTVLVKPCICVVLYSQTEHARRNKVRILGTRGGNP